MKAHARLRVETRCGLGCRCPLSPSVGGIALRRRPRRALPDLGFLSFLCISVFSPSDTSACTFMCFPFTAYWRHLACLKIIRVSLSKPCWFLSEIRRPCITATYCLDILQKVPPRIICNGLKDLDAVVNSGLHCLIKWINSFNAGVNVLQFFVRTMIVSLSFQRNGFLSATAFPPCVFLELL